MRKTGLRCLSIAPSLSCRLDRLAWLALLIASLSALPSGEVFSHSQWRKNGCLVSCLAAIASEDNPLRQNLRSVA